MAIKPDLIESKAGQIVEDVVRRGGASERRVAVTLEPDAPDDWIAAARRYTRPR